MKWEEQGFSLLEMALVLAVMGIIAVTAIGMMPRLSSVFQQVVQGGTLQAMDQTLTGFALTHSRLPCPDTDNDGMENCNTATTMVGTIPYKMLGLDAPAVNRRGIPLRYGVYRNASATPVQDADLTALKNRYAPLIPVTATAVVNLNGLDFCTALGTAARSSESNARVHIGVGGPNVAFALADAGAQDADQKNGVWDGLNGGSGSAFERPGTPMSATYDDTVLAVGFNVLAARLGCPATVAKVNGMARAAYVADDLRRLGDFYKQFRDFVVRLKTTAVEIATARRDVAISGTVVAAAIVASSLALATETSGIGAGASVAAVANSTAAIAALVSAIIGLNSANTALAMAQTRQSNAGTALTQAKAFALLRSGILKTTDAKGLLQ